MKGGHAVTFPLDTHHYERVLIDQVHHFLPAPAAAPDAVAQPLPPRHLLALPGFAVDVLQQHAHKRDERQDKGAQCDGAQVTADRGPQGPQHGRLVAARPAPCASVPIKVGYCSGDDHSIAPTDELCCPEEAEYVVSDEVGPVLKVPVHGNQLLYVRAPSRRAVLLWHGGEDGGRAGDDRSWAHPRDRPRIGCYDVGLFEGRQRRQRHVGCSGHHLDDALRLNGGHGLNVGRKHDTPRAP
mmetsp:Transcript_15977/g.28417  ORF Transcript_15977/g.28417 Transcript_15977/m.28417 type:complete len:240 (-) Transcript_15977:1732-2451(-)